MEPDIRWIQAFFRLPADCRHVAVPESGRAALQAMAVDLVRTPGQVAIYIPEGTEDIYRPGPSRGRVVGVVRLLPMPSGQRVEDYFYNDWDGSRRWPIGWPCQVVYAPAVAECPSLREHVEHLFGGGSFGGYVSRFQRGPFALDEDMRERLNRDFAGFTPLE